MSYQCQPNTNYKPPDLRYEGAKNTNNQPHGIGTLYDVEGNLFYEGSFNNDEFHGQGDLYEDGQIVYSGNFANNKKHGEGTSYNDGNIQFEGTWQNDKESFGTYYVYTSSKINQYTGDFSKTYQDPLTQIMDDKLNRTCRFKKSSMGR